MYSPCFNSVRSSASNSPQKSKKTKTFIPCLDYTKQSRIPHRGLGDSDKRFTIADYRHLEKIATAEPFEGWLKVFEVAKCDRIGKQRRWKLSVWNEAESCYRVIAGQFFRSEIDWIRERYRQTQDKGRFALAIEVWLQRAIEACNGREVAA